MGRKECSVKCVVWRKQWEVKSVKCGVWSVKCGVWSFSLECEERSVKCEVWSVRFGVWRKQWEVRSVKCEVLSVECEVWSVKFQFGVRRAQCEVWSVKCGVWSLKFGVRRVQCEVECEVWSLECEECSVKCGVWSVKTLLRLSLKKSNGCRGKDTVGTGCLWTIGHLCLGNFRRRLARVYVIMFDSNAWTCLDILFRACTDFWRLGETREDIWGGVYIIPFSGKWDWDRYGGYDLYNQWYYYQ